MHVQTISQLCGYCAITERRSCRLLSLQSLDSSPGRGERATAVTGHGQGVSVCGC